MDPCKNPISPLLPSIIKVPLLMANFVTISSDQKCIGKDSLPLKIFQIGAVGDLVWEFVVKNGLHATAN